MSLVSSVARLAAAQAPVHSSDADVGVWEDRFVYPLNGSKRGRLAVSKSGHLIIVLPDSRKPIMRILLATKESGFADYHEVWVGSGFSGEPLVDTVRLEADGILSLFVRQDIGDGSKKNVVVLDFKL